MRQVYYVVLEDPKGRRFTLGRLADSQEEAEKMLISQYPESKLVK